MRVLKNLTYLRTTISLTSNAHWSLILFFHFIILYSFYSAMTTCVQILCLQVGQVTLKLTSIGECTVGHLCNIHQTCLLLTHILWGEFYFSSKRGLANVYILVSITSGHLASLEGHNIFLVLDHFELARLTKFPKFAKFAKPWKIH